RRRGRVPRLAGRLGHEGAAGGRGDPFRHRARLHPRRGGGVRGSDRIGKPGGGARKSAPPFGGARLRREGRRRDQLPLQRLAIPPRGAATPAGIAPTPAAASTAASTSGSS